MTGFTYVRLTDRASVAALFQRFNDLKVNVVLDLETTGLNRFKDTIICGVVAVAGETTAFWVPPEFLDELTKLTTPLVLHNFKFDFAFLYHAGIDLRGKEVWDTMLMHHLLDENAEHGLDAIIQEKWNDPYKEVFWSAYKSFEEAPEDAAFDYAGRDVLYTGRLFHELHSGLQLQGVPHSLIVHVHSLATALYETELSGVRVDLDYLVRVGEELKARIASATTAMKLAAPEHELVEMDMWLAEMDKRKTPKGKAGVPKPAFNWESTKQLQALIYGHLGVREVRRKSKSTGKISTTLDDGALEELANEHPVIATIRDCRSDQKVLGSFIEGTLDRQVGGRIYPSFNVNGTVTGRISSSNPNLQQLPRDGGVRGVYVPDLGHKLISCDYGMLEVVIAAHYSRDAALLKIIYDGASKHDITATALGISRQIAKTVNFAAQYQCSPMKIASILNVSKKEGEYAYNKYWETYAGEKAVIDDCKGKVDRGEPIVSIFGRKRRFPREFDVHWHKEAAYRQAYSSLIQGTGADVTHRAFYTVSKALKAGKLGSALFEVHDEILIQAKQEFVDSATSLLKTIMIDTGVSAGLNVPLTVDCSDPLDRWTK